MVHLRLARYLRGTKYDQLQQAIASTDIPTSLSSSVNPPIPIKPTNITSTFSASGLTHTSISDIRSSTSIPIASMTTTGTIEHQFNNQQGHPCTTVTTLPSDIDSDMDMPPPPPPIALPTIPIPRSNITSTCSSSSNAETITNAPAPGPFTSRGCAILNEKSNILHSNDDGNGDSHHTYRSLNEFSSFSAKSMPNSTRSNQRLAQLEREWSVRLGPDHMILVSTFSCTFFYVSLLLFDFLLLIGFFFLSFFSFLLMFFFLTFAIQVAQIEKFQETGGLGISLEGTVDKEDVKEVRSHHYIRAILPEGPVGREGTLKAGDEILQVNGRELINMDHVEVVSLLKDLPRFVEMVCARQQIHPLRTNSTSTTPVTSNITGTSTTSTGHNFFGAKNSIHGNISSSGNGSNYNNQLVSSMNEGWNCENEQNRGMKREAGASVSITQGISSSSSDRLVKAKSDGSLAITGSPIAEVNSITCEDATRIRSRSLEPLTGLAMWSSEPMTIHLVKGDRGLGFSILDYQVNFYFLLPVKS